MNNRFSQTENGWHRRLAAGGLLLVVLLAGIWIGRELAPDADERLPRSTPTQLPTESRAVNGVPVGYLRTKQGAVQAATNFTRVMAAVSDDADAYVAAADTMAASEWAAEARRLAHNGLEFFRERYGTGGSFTFAPVRYRLVSYSDTEATVGVWGVTVASGPKIQGIEESWLTGTLDLVWVSGDWRLAGQTSVTGPTPELLQATESVAAAGLDQFEEYENAPSP